jgi:parallel beta-helix repeat protein
VYLCGGTYNITGSILLKSYIQVKGAGRSTVIFITNATNADLDVFKSANEAGAASYVRLENFTINGNKASQASGTMNGVQLTYVQHSTVRDVVIFSMKGSGIVLNANCISDRIDRCRILACDSAGIKLYSCGVDNIITGNYCSANVQGVYVYTADRCSITGNHLVTNSQYGIFTEAMTNSDIIGNQCSSNGIVHISIWQNSNYNNIQGNTCRKGTGCISGLYISDVSATGNYATNNDLHDAGSGSNYSDDGTSTVTTAGNRTT